MKQTILILLLCVLFIHVGAQNLSTKGTTIIHGKLLDETTKQPVVYATISLKNETKKIIAGGMSGDKGEFSLDSIPSGNYTLEIQFMGYKPLSKAITIVKEAKLDLGISFLVQDATLLKEVAIQGQQPTVSLKLDKKTFIVGKDVLSQNGSVNDLLNGVPSVSVSPTGGISLRGNSNVNVLINGRRTGLVQGNMLDQIPADQIEKIEIITNPSSRYDAAGSAGIINVVLKKNKKVGFNGQVKLIAGLPNDARILPSVNYKSDKINLFSTFGYRNSDYVGLYKTNQVSALPNTSTYLTNIQNENRHDDGKNMYLGADFYLNAQNTITAAFFKNATHDSDKIKLGYDYSASDYKIDSVLLRNGTSSEIRDYNQIEFNYTKSFKTIGKKWTIDMLYDFWNSDKDWNLATEKMFPTSQTYQTIRTSSEGSSKDFLLQTDFVIPVNKTTFEMGIKAENRLVTSDYLAEQQVGNNWQVYEGIDNNLDYNEKIGSGYLQVSHNFKKLSFMLGLRTELTKIEIEDKTKTYYNQKEYGRLFPSINLSYQLAPTATLQWNYSKRINRPSLFLLYPFNEVTDLNSQFVGNPDLNPSYADVLELGFLQNWKTLTFNPSIYYQKTKNYIQDFTYRNASGIFITSPVNIDEEIRKGFELSVLFNPKKWIQLNGELNVYDFKQRGTYQNKNLDFSGHTLTSRISMQLKFPKQFSFQTRYNLTGAQQNAQSTTKAISFVDIGASKNLLNDRATLVLDGTNILNSRQTRRTTKGENYELYQVTNFNAARYRLSFTYRFNAKSDAARQAKSGNRN
ncbi:TonB-dependent receptor [Pedobacter polaris]|uniref:TonB-dependent receptor n=1 Tax=Pedobacter polaris TaxID=2571273 RepID=A0A4U1CV83_9SPHI|nr:outer membrane beta-barrel family protein [Pedobacter polaris]TKC12824.1 TonB-dependent receptor [Pedobacter polaris]